MVKIHCIITKEVKEVIDQREDWPDIDEIVDAALRTYYGMDKRYRMSD